MRFLSATWSNLILMNYAVPAEALTPYLPPGCVPDLGWGGQAHVSLVAFDFLDTKVLGVPWPGFRNFPEINLRAYVKHEPTGTRGVVFVSELVPQRFVAAMARWTYNEPYRAVPIRSAVTQRDGRIDVDHHARFDGREHHIGVTAAATATTPPEDGFERFFSNHRWGFNRSHWGRLIRYEVVHPLWRCHAVESCRVDWDFEAAYGPRWGFLRERQPASMLLAEGSHVEVRLWTKP
jgi:uncharacterized protein